MASTSQRLAVVRRHATSSVPRIFPKTWREVERASRKARPVTHALLATLAPLAGLVRSLTFDRGSEFAEYALIERALDIKACFADPNCAWQRGSNENTNGLPRQYIPRSRDIDRCRSRSHREEAQQAAAQGVRIQNPERGTARSSATRCTSGLNPPPSLLPWLQNLVTQRSPGMIAVSSPREGSITCKSTPTVSHGVTAKL